MSFKTFLLTEDNAYLGRKVGEVLTDLQDLQQDSENLGTRHLSRLADEVVIKIRLIIQSNWSEKQKYHLEDLQKVAVAIKRPIIPPRVAI